MANWLTEALSLLGDLAAFQSSAVVLHVSQKYDSQLREIIPFSFIQCQTESPTLIHSTHAVFFFLAGWGVERDFNC